MNLSEKLEKHIQQKLMGFSRRSDADMMAKIVSESKDSDLTMSGIARRLES
jgi:hypothetical protein